MARRLTFLCAAGARARPQRLRPRALHHPPQHPTSAPCSAGSCAGARTTREHNSPPYASSFVSPATVDSGDTVEQMSNVSYDLDGRIVRYEWDADGLPGFEIAGTHTRTEAQVFIRDGGESEERRITLRVTDDSREDSVSSQRITILRPAGDGPIASFTVTANPVQARTVAVFDVTASVKTTSFEWDFDGDGSVKGLQASRVEHGYQTQGTRNVTLRVRDDAGRTDTQTIPVRVIDARAAAVARRSFSARLTRVRVPDGLRALGDVRVRGRLTARGLGPLRRFRRARWTARLNLSVDGTTAKLRGRAIARFPRGAGRLCLRIRGVRRAGAPTGRVTLLGGRGPAARLRGGGTFTFGFRGATPRPAGRLQARLGRPRPCPWRSP